MPTQLTSLQDRIRYCKYIRELLKIKRALSSCDQRLKALEEKVAEKPPNGKNKDEVSNRISVETFLFIRRKFKITQRELAILLGAHFTSVHRWEKVKTKVRKVIAARLIRLRTMGKKEIKSLLKQNKPVEL